MLQIILDIKDFFFNIRKFIYNISRLIIEREKNELLVLSKNKNICFYYCDIFYIIQRYTTYKYFCIR